MESLIRQTKIAVLWILAAVAMSAHMILLVLDPTALKKAGEWALTAEQGEWVFTAVFWLVPLWMAFVVMAMKGPANRWVNFAVAIAFTGVNIWHFFVCGVPLLKGGPFAEPMAHHILLVGSTVVATALIAWFAWTWPRQEA